MKIVLYSTNCPLCLRLKEKLDNKQICYVECQNKDKMLEKGIDFVPSLEIDGEIYNFKDAVRWVNEYEK